MKNNIEALTLLESENSETPNIGTVSVGWNKRELVEQKIKNAIEAHFDASIDHPLVIDWSSLESYMDVEISARLFNESNGYEAKIIIQRTIIY